MISSSNNIHIDSIPRNVTVSELTTADMRRMLKARESIGEDADIDPLEMLVVGDGLLLSDLSRLTDLTQAEIDSLTEAEITTLIEASKRMNPRFFAQILGTLSRFAAMSLRDNAESSSETSSRSSPQDTPVPGITQ